MKFSKTYVLMNSDVKIEVGEKRPALPLENRTSQDVDSVSAETPVTLDARFVDWSHMCYYRILFCDNTTL